LQTEKQKKKMLQAINQNPFKNLHFAFAHFGPRGCAGVTKKTRMSLHHLLTTFVRCYILNIYWTLRVSSFEHYGILASKIEKIHFPARNYISTEKNASAKEGVAIIVYDQRGGKKQ
jgi:hypothetical protein